MSGVKDLKRLYSELKTLTVFGRLREDKVISALSRLLEYCGNEGGIDTALEAYSQMISALFESGTDSLGAYVMRIVGDDENVYMKAVGRGVSVPDTVKACVRAELAILQEVASLTPEALAEALGRDGYLPFWRAESVDIAEYYRERTENISRYGYGMYARYIMFYLNGEGSIVPVKYPDETRLTDLIDYKREQGIIIDNTKALLAGRPAANILLTGDAGTGKSSTVKAVVNEYAREGLRILEIRKEQIRELPAILDELTQNPLKFIIFIDDLSFGSDDDNYSTLKAILEGSVSARSQNVVIYATSNRRHIVREKFSDRDGDDIHRNDTIQETVSLSERFGLQITFLRPDKATYLDIVHHLATAHGIEYDEKLIDLAAEQFIIMRGSTRSARAARQFVDGILAGQNIKIKE